ncbi:MAG: trypsin-like peptidase domain-containing protein [Candidatus Eisenbacteria bacterium]
MWSDWVDGVKLFVWTALVLVLGATVGLIGSGVIDLGETFSRRGGGRVQDSGVIRESDGGSRSGRGLERLGIGRNADDESARGGAFADVARVVGPAVVSIEVRRRFEHPAIDEGSNLPEGEFDIPSSGSGFIYDADGYVLTNNHVVSGARRVWVHLADGRTFDASVVGTDPETDVAVLEVRGGHDLPVLSLGRATELAIGDWVAAVGNPLGYLDGTFTVGVVSGKGRSEVAIRGGAPSYQDFIQTDAAINFGNSGGPLVDAWGRVVGINTAFGGEGSGIGFAIPIELASEVAEKLVSSGRVPRAYLGVLLQDLDLDLARGLGLGAPNGVIIREVYPDTPASAAGLEAGDAILTIGDETVRDVAGFRLQVASSAIGTPTTLRGLRWTEPLELQVVLAERESPVPTEESELAIRPSGMGLDVEALPDSVARSGDIGIRVREVVADSWAADAGVEVGDRILEADGVEMRTEAEYRSQRDRAVAERRPLVLGLQRGPTRWFVAIPTDLDGGNR